jgi:hypothetical protein
MSLALKPTHATVKAYYETLHQYGQLHIDHEGAVRSAFQELLAKSGRKAKPQLTLVPEYRIERRGSSVIVDGALVDLYHLPHGYWEAKDERDDLAKEVQLKLDKGYPRDNIIFQAPECAILYQGGRGFSTRTSPALNRSSTSLTSFSTTKLHTFRSGNKRLAISPNVFRSWPPLSRKPLTRNAARSGYTAIASAQIPELHFGSSTDAFQCFPFYTYAEDGSNRRENITDWALEQFRARYHDPSIRKWDIFHYIYAVLHHPEYRERYAANLRRELPRIPFVSSCHPEAAESLAQPRTPNEGSVHSGGRVAGASCIDPSAHEERGPQDDSVGGSAGKSVVQANARSFGSVNGLASESIHSAQDDRARSETGKNADFGAFRAFVKAGKRLAEIHVHYEKQGEYPLAKAEKAGERLDWRVTKMRLSKDKTSLVYNQFLTLSGIPKETYEYRLGNRSALEWVIDQYQVSTDKRSGITNDPNRADDPQYVLRLIGQVITVSLETVKIVRAMPLLGLPD